jgi:hypothetical protein
MPSLSYLANKAKQIANQTNDDDVRELALIVSQLARECEDVEKKAEDAERDARRAKRSARG